MKLENYLNLVFDKIRKQFPNAKIAYELKENTGTHFFQVTPESVYGTETFIDLDYDLSNLFHDNEFDGDICFISEDALTELTPTKTSLPALSFAGAPKAYSLDFNKPLHFGSFNRSTGIQFKTTDTEPVYDLDLSIDFTPSTFNSSFFKDLTASFLLTLDEQKSYENKRVNDHKSEAYDQLSMAA